MKLKTEGTLGIINLPLKELLHIAKCYGTSGSDETKEQRLPILLVAIYNVEQLAVEIAKHLEGRINDSSKRNNSSK